ncbi:MAG: maltose ABC transporter permease MalF [Burkholderiales bacterium]
MKRLDFIRSGMKWLLVAGLAATFLYLVVAVYAGGHALWALALLSLVCLGFYIYLGSPTVAYRYLFPGVIGMLVFVAFPLLYTAQIGFTNYSSANLLSQDLARSYLLEQTLPDEQQVMVYELHADADKFRLVLFSLNDEGARTDRMASLISPALSLQAGDNPAPVVLLPAESSGFQATQALSLAELLRHRDALMRLKLKVPSGQVLSYAGVREFGPLRNVWQANQDGSLTQTESGVTFKPNAQSGFFENDKGERLSPGYKVGVGLANYQRMINDPDFRGPFISIFIWTLIFSTLTVMTTLVIGLLLAVLLNWEALRFRTAYRTLLFLPYAVPGFISILVFKGLFNQNFGEINGILNVLFGVKPAWFAEPLLAKVMILTVNTWLGFPYIMILCSGLIKAIPADLYEASAIAGAKPWSNLWKITVPLIMKPLTPLLISVFAFNFNNFVLISLLTDGRPDFLNTKVPAGTTDILVSYTYRIAFQDSGQNFGLAAAISTVIFFMVALLSLANLKLTQRSK